ncbi:NUDIX domain-containing protein, partial [Wenyingzhuangia sp. 1_MG-2023]|nr:NUDIX domain-containing protein [Wenyingzhuangia sp. 1_MG-2023]
EYLLQPRPQTGIWGGLWSFPEATSLAQAEQWLSTHYGDSTDIQELSSFRHTFSHYHLHIHPVEVHLPRAPTYIGEAQQHWYNPHNPSELGLAAPVKKLLHASL